MNVGDDEYTQHLDPEVKAELLELAYQYFDGEIDHLHRNSGVPEDAIAYLRREYAKAAIMNPEAMREIREYLNVPDPSDFTAPESAEGS